MLSWFGKKLPELNNTSAPLEMPVVQINTMAALREKLLKRSADDIYQFNKRGYTVPPALALNTFLFFVSSKSIIDKVRYKIRVKVLIEFIDYCHFNAAPSDMRFTRIACGAMVDKYNYYYTIIDDVENAVLTAAAEVQHTSFSKTANEMLAQCTARKEKSYFSMTPSNLSHEQKKMKPFWEPYINPDGVSLVEDSNSLDVTYSESNDSGQDTSIAAPKSVRDKIVQEKLISHHSPKKDPPVSRLTNDVPVPVVVVPSTIEPEKVSTIDKSVMDPELIELIDNDPKMTSLLEPVENNRNSDYIPINHFVTAENNVMIDRLTEIIDSHHENKAEEISYNEMNSSVLRKMDREERRYLSRKRVGKEYTGPKTYATNRGEQFDFRTKTHDARGRQVAPNKAFTKQDDDYIDYAFYGFIREYGTMVDDIMKLPLGYDFNSQRRGSSVYIRAIHFRNTFTHVTGTKASGRMIVWWTEKEGTYTNLLGRHWNNVEPHDILQKSVTMYAGDLEEAEAADLFYNPTIMSQYDFKNVILGGKYKILYDYYCDLNTQAVKGLVGEDVESVDSIKTKWVKIDDLDLPLFYDGDDEKPSRGQLGVLFMGDYFGGEIETNCTLRVFYNSK